MKAIISAIKGLFDIVNLVFSFFIAMIENLMYLVKYLVQAVSIATDFILTFPPWLRVFASITIGISVMYMLLGREGGAK